MPLDHYVSQVHLRNFYSPADDRLYVIRKSDLKQFRAHSERVCGVGHGSTNTYLTHARAIEDFLKGVEPKYEELLAKLRAGRIDEDCVYTFSGFTAYVATCAPAAMRLRSAPLQDVLAATATVLDRQGAFGKAPEELGGKSMTELIEDGTLDFDVDGKYPQAVGISSIMNLVSTFGNSPWEILRNEEADTPFFTSDFPVPIELRPDGVTNRIVPLAPDLAIRIMPDRRLSGAEPDLSFVKFRCRHRTLKRSEVVDVKFD